MHRGTDNNDKGRVALSHYFKDMVNGAIRPCIKDISKLLEYKGVAFFPIKDYYHREANVDLYLKEGWAIVFFADNLKMDQVSQNMLSTSFFLQYKENIYFLTGGISSYTYESCGPFFSLLKNAGVSIYPEGEVERFRSEPVPQSNLIGFE